MTDAREALLEWDLHGRFMSAFVLRPSPAGGRRVGMRAIERHCSLQAPSPPAPLPPAGEGSQGRLRILWLIVSSGKGKDYGENMNTPTSFNSEMRHTPIVY